MAGPTAEANGIGGIDVTLTPIVGGQLMLPLWRPTRVFVLSRIEVTLDAVEDAADFVYWGSDLVVQLWEAQGKDRPESFVPRAEVRLRPGDRRAVGGAQVDGFGLWDTVRLAAGSWVAFVHSDPPWDDSSDAPLTPSITARPHGTYA